MRRRRAGPLPHQNPTRCVTHPLQQAAQRVVVASCRGLAGSHRLRHHVGWDGWLASAGWCYSGEGRVQAERRFISLPVGGGFSVGGRLPPAPRRRRAHRRAPKRKRIRSGSTAHTLAKGEVRREGGADLPRPPAPRRVQRGEAGGRAPPRVRGDLSGATGGGRARRRKEPRPGVEKVAGPASTTSATSSTADRIGPPASNGRAPKRAAGPPSGAGGPRRGASTHSGWQYPAAGRAACVPGDQQAERASRSSGLPRRPGRRSLPPAGARKGPKGRARACFEREGERGAGRHGVRGNGCAGRAQSRSVRAGAHPPPRRPPPAHVCGGLAPGAGAQPRAPAGRGAAAPSPFGPHGAPEEGGRGPRGAAPLGDTQPPAAPPRWLCKGCVCSPQCFAFFFDRGAGRAWGCGMWRAPLVRALASDGARTAAASTAAAAAGAVRGGVEATTRAQRGARGPAPRAAAEAMPYRSGGARRWAQKGHGQERAQARLFSWHKRSRKSLGRTLRWAPLGRAVWGLWGRGPRVHCCTPAWLGRLGKARGPQAERLHAGPGCCYAQGALAAT
jgi:hypothetical protein